MRTLYSPIYLCHLQLLIDYFLLMKKDLDNLRGKCYLTVTKFYMEIRRSGNFSPPQDRYTGLCRFFQNFAIVCMNIYVCICFEQK